MQFSLRWHSSVHFFLFIEVALCFCQGDFLEEDLKFQSRACGGRKAVFLKSIDDLFRKRVVGPKLGEGVMDTSCDMK